MKATEEANATTVRQLMALVRASLWQVPADTVPFEDNAADWDAIGSLSLKQTVAILAIEGAMTLPPELQPPKEWMRKAWGYMERNRRTHVLVDGCTAEAFRRLKEGGICPVLLKGQGYARYYAKPTLRQCGDVDIYVGEDDFLRAYELSREAGWEEKREFKAEAKHYECLLRDVAIELHQRAGELPWSGGDNRFRRWSRDELGKGETSVNIDGEEIGTGTALFNMILVLMHLYLHFLSGGIGLRQICDWTMIMHAHYGSVDLRELDARLREFGLRDAWRLFAPIAVEKLGLPEEECPLYSAKLRKRAEKVLSLVMKEGNFGKYSDYGTKRPEGYLRGKLYSFGVLTRRMLTRVPAAPIGSLRYYCNYVVKGVGRVMSGG
ncbi:MAG: nucleotidyltransferase family protein [Muribaculaceae bacterium]|nr:nucleotidyltransferase family protein [Muribaculaceae bacterium]